ncbi:MAG: methionine--tRNA ligase [Chitinivibrionales bacterium]|nr:methionine--tRNA ligase [Chitinivibrionales bacterium]
MPLEDEQESTRQTILVTQALPYANGDIHLGHLVEAVQADIYVRFHKLKGNKAIFVCADDTHGTPIELSARNKGITPEELIKDAWQKHVDDYAAFDIEFDNYYSTNSEENRRYSEYIFERLQQNNLIVEREVSQYYCEHDKRFLPDRFVKGTCPKCGAGEQYGDVCELCGSTYEPTDMKNPRCSICGNPPVLKKSTHFFVKLDQCADFLKEFVGSGNVLQEDMRNFVNSWIDEGLKEWCISRDGPYFGFKIPGTEDKYFYVWLDAPVGYIASTDKWCRDHGEQTDDFWSAHSDSRIVHFIGKDIVYFHALFWPVMLKNAELKLPNKIYVHGFLTVEGEKMSKSRGTFILARDFAAKMKHPLATEYLRFYYGAKLTSSAGDIDLNIEEFCSRANTTLVNNIGNLHNRTFIFCERYFDGRIPDAQWDEDLASLVAQTGAEIEAHLEAVEYKEAIEKIHVLGNTGNKYYQDNKPWELVKSDKQRAAQVMVTCANLVRSLAVFLKPVTPGVTAVFEKQLDQRLGWNDHHFSLRDVAFAPTEKLAKPIDRSEFDLLYMSGKSAASALEIPLNDSGVTFDDFKNIDLRVAIVKQAEKVKKSNKLLKLQVAIGPQSRQIIAGIAQHYKPEEIIGKQIIVVANLKPAKLMGELSQGMLLAAQDGNSLCILGLDKQVTPGSKVS